jgi:hypothetical protein
MTVSCTNSQVNNCHTASMTDLCDKGLSVVMLLCGPQVETSSNINSINNQNSAGYDEISNKTLKLCAQYLSKHLTYIYNTSIIQGNFAET